MSCTSWIYICRIWQAEGVKFACCLSSVLIKLFTWYDCGGGSSWPEPAKWWSVPGQPSGMTAALSTARLLAFPVTTINPPPTHQQTHPRWLTDISGDNNLRFPNLWLHLTPNLSLLRHSRPAVGEQSKTGAAAVNKKLFNCYTEVQYRHARESDNCPRSTEILQINQWAALLIPSRQRQIKCIIDLCNPSICKSDRGKGWGKGGDSLALQHHLYIPLSSCSPFPTSLKTSWRVGRLGWVQGECHGAGSCGISVQGWIWLRLKTWLFLINDPQAAPH